MTDLISSAPTQLSSAALGACAWLRDYARNRMNSQLADEHRCFPPHLFIDLGRMGLMGMQGPKSMGGLGLTNREAVAVMAQVGAIDLSLGSVVCIQNFLAGRLLVRHSSPFYQETVVPDVISGRQLVAFALTENAAGSDPRRIQATATAQGDGRWSVNGTKIWSGLANWASVVCTFANSVGRDGESGGVIGFAMRQPNPGIILGPEARTMGLRAIVQSSIHFRDVICGKDDVIGVVGEGMKAAQDTMVYCRLIVAALALGASRRAIQIAGRYRERRSISTGPMADNSVVSMMMSDCIARTLALECLVDFAAHCTDQSSSSELELITASKIIGPEFAWQTIDTCMQTVGGRGYIETNVLTRMLRDARIFRIFEGPTESMAVYLGALALQGNPRITSLILDSGDQNLVNLYNEAIEVGKTRRSQSNDKQSKINSRFVIGEIVAYALTLVAVQARRRTADNPALAYAEHSIKSIYRDKVCRFAANSSVPRMEPGILGSALRDINEAVGDVEQTAPGEEWQMDPLLSLTPLLS